VPCRGRTHHCTPHKLTNLATNKRCRQIRTRIHEVVCSVAKMTSERSPLSVRTAAPSVADEEDGTPARLTIDQLRHTSPIAPGERATRTLRLTEMEYRLRQQQARHSTPESLMRRPGSNARTRTPTRNESPLDQDAFRRHRVVEDDQSLPSATTNSTTVITAVSHATTGTGRISIRPFAGLAIGTRVISPRRVCFAYNEFVLMQCECSASRFPPMNVK
jgi:hypothetical protein